MIMRLVELIKDNVVHFKFYRKGHLYYSINYEKESFIFPVPIDDIGDATFLKKDKAMMFMRYIKKAQKEGTFVSNA